MLKNFFIKTIIFCFGLFLYGIPHIFLGVEENHCRMTYMFGSPQFSKVKFERNREFSHYGLYYYYEGRLQKDVNNLILKGAPVIFVPGNAGSYKQVRSLASVALRKGLDNDRGIHLDYFTIDYEEQLSALYGGYLEDQQQFLSHCILAVRNLYKKNANIEKNIILVGHSMGGKVAQAVLTDLNVAPYINTIIYISTPLDNPVLDFDHNMNQFYAETNRYISTKRKSYIADANTNMCCDFEHRIPPNGDGKDETNILYNVLMVSIGGGNRDLLVRDALTTSKFSDIHAMTSSIPKVWLSCDHLSAVWCLQLVTVINRFIFAISNIDKKKNVYFLEDKSQRTHNAINFFVKPLAKIPSEEVYFPKSTLNAMWQEESKNVYLKVFKNGLRSGYNRLLPISKYKNYNKLFVEVDSFDDITDWIYGCKAANVSDNIICDKGTSLFDNIQGIASRENIRSMALIDLQQVNQFHSDWTHFMLRLQPTNKPITLKLDVYNQTERTLNIKVPSWFYFSQQVLINETNYGDIHYEIFITGLEEPFPTMEFNIEGSSCKNEDFNVAAKLCVPWARGFERFSHITKVSNTFYINVPISMPKHYNTSKNPVSLELILDPICRYKISYKFSIAGAMSKIVKELYHWIPAHLTAVLFVVLRNQIVQFNTAANAFIKPYAGFFQWKSLYVITACRVLKKLLLRNTFLPSIDASDYSIQFSIIIQSTAIAISIILVFILWAFLILHGNILLRIALRITRISEALSNVLIQIISVLPLTFGVLFISIALRTCSGVALTLAALFYFILLSNAYKNYLENLAWEKASELYRKLLTDTKENGQHNSNNSDPPVITESTVKTGLDNIAFHASMLLLLIVMSSLNIGVSIAWIKSQYLGHTDRQLPDPSLIPAIGVIFSLSILLQLEAPHKSSGYRVVAIILYLSSCLCIIYCQENLYRLNYLIAFVYVTVAFQEIIRRLLSCIGIQY